MRRLVSHCLAVFIAFALGVLPADVAAGSAIFALSRYKVAAKSKVAFAEFYEIDASGAVVPDGAKGKLQYKQSGPSFDFVFNAQRLEPNTEYALIWSREPEVTIPNKAEVICRGVSNGAGNLNMADSYKFNLDLLSAKFLLIPSRYENPLRPIEHLENFLLCQTPVSFEETGSELKCGAFMRPEAPDFDALGPNAGDKAVDFTLWGFKPENLNPVGNAPQPLEKFTLSELLKEKPVLLVVGAFT
ncbi:MAG: hypothetical protein QME75_07830 [Deltaproteobacteria bacterium]|nr:hypothetical protein [Deltaproteobacteria bacterium]